MQQKMTLPGRRYHTPEADHILRVVAGVFGVNRDDIEGESRKEKTVIAREVYAYLLHTRRASKIEEVMQLTGYKKAMVHKAVANIKGLIRVSADFAGQVWEAERKILGVPSNNEKDNNCSCGRGHADIV